MSNDINEKTNNITALARFYRPKTPLIKRKKELLINQIFIQKVTVQYELEIQMN